jgi:hypothetical protein
MAKGKSKEEVVEKFSWQISVSLTAGSQEELESAVEQIEAKLDDAGFNVDGATVEDFKVRMT